MGNRLPVASTRHDPFPRGRALLIGVVHLRPLPGAPRFDAAGGIEAVLDAARRDARALVRGGADALIVENFGDLPFEKERVAPETVAGMALALVALRAEVACPLGVNVLRNDARAALGLCAAAGAAFLRVNVHAGAAVTDQGIVEGRAAETLRERTRLAPSAAILADVHVKHATALGREDVAEAAQEALERALADFVIVSGRATGAPTDPLELAAVAERVGREHVLIGSGARAETAAVLLAHARGAIVGTALKQDGRVEAPVDVERVRAVRAAFDAARP